ncbi:MAG: DNA-directed RNA polymerase subunit beta' [Candidatus Omnitrophica bacterium]|nr:DNA-directed RNA polymerase subunit beta' [Candidatus Omnitrophota bacterium]
MKSTSIKNFGKIKEFYKLPNMVEIQLDSYADFLQLDRSRTKRKRTGLEAVFQDAFPIESFDGAHRLEYAGYVLGRPKYSIEECRKRGITYGAPLKVKIRLRSKKETREQEVYMGDMPLMTETGTFIVNGDERVVVSQLHRSPGISFEEFIHPNGKKLHIARIIPYRGAWVEIETDIADALHITLDRRRKIMATTFLRVLGLSTDEDILRKFCGIEKIEAVKKSQLEKVAGSILAADISIESGLAFARRTEKITADLVNRIWNAGIRKIKVLTNPIPEIINTLAKDHAKTKEDALLDIYRRLRPGDPATLENAEILMNRMFLDSKRYDLGRVGRFILNRKLDMKEPIDNTVLNIETVVRAMLKLIRLKNGEGSIDDIDHLGNRRVRSIGELLQNQLRIGLARMERAARERMNIYDLENIMPHNLINAKLISNVVRDFFGRSQLSQFMDQTNPLAELTHKRRLSAVGPGGLNRERAGFEVRDVHYSHYGRMCPIETPEGPNIGLIASLSSFAKINEHGFLVTPYRKVEDGRVTDKTEYLSADVEDNYIIAQANARLGKDGWFIDSKIFCRYKNDFVRSEPKNVQYMDVSPKQLVSVAASLIPFLEHDDANRALMGSNMQRQAVPLLYTELPLVQTGIEARAAKDSGAVVVASNSGRVTHVDGSQIAIGGKIYKLRKFEKSNASTCINQRPLVKTGQSVKDGDVIADGTSTASGELALGRNVLVAFMPWRGYNFEDAILISEKLIKEDIYTSIHVEEFEIEARDTRLGKEEITRDIPNVGEEMLNNLDKDGVIRLGAEVGPGDILVGKVTPKSETELSPEEKLLRAIFGEKAGDVRDASLTTPPGIEGIVVDVKVFSRKEARTKTKEEKTKEQKKIQEVSEFYESQIESLKNERVQKLAKLLHGVKLSASLLDEETGDVIVARNKSIKKSNVKKLERCDMSTLRIEDDEKLEDDIKKIISLLDEQIEELAFEMEREIDRIKRGDELPPGVLKKVSVFVASKRKIAVGDKMAGRHGNKGVIAKILPEEDMPFLPDGTPVEIVLNPLGVPSRMNVGQILETHLGWAAQILGYRAISPIFDGATENEIKIELQKAGLPEDGCMKLVDGMTGRPFDQKVTVGYIYMMKLAHLVDDKIHARSIGPYSLVTQQPLGGKAQFGGQRFGEMEVWALEAYGAAFTLQELLTVKSDDVLGRTRIYEAIVKGENTFQPGTPESFNVLVKELQSLGLDIVMEKNSLAASEKASANESLSSFENPFDAVTIKIASSDTIKSWSHGEVRKPETINYRTFKPEKDGLFCEKIFGPTRDWECSCGKYKRIKHKGIVCDRCGVEVTRSNVRRQRMGHIELAAPVSHVWFFKASPSRMSALLELSLRDLERVLYYEEFIVIDPGDTPLKKKELLTEERYREYREKFGASFKAGMGAEAIRTLMKELNIEDMTKRIKKAMKETKTEQTKKKLSKQLRVIESFNRSENKPEWMIMDIVPVIPPDLRPLVPLDGGRFATSDLNDLYRRVINRNNRLKKLIELKAPEVIVRNEKRMLQEAVDALFDNGRHGRAVLGPGNRPLKSLSDMLKGKQGRFRQNLLGKRVDYSGRSVIVIGPELKLHECGLPKKMALELFEPFIIKKLKEKGFVHTIKSAKRMVERAKLEVWDILDEVIKEHPVLLNRAPTLHRLGIQAFQPRLIEGKAIRIHPLVCAAFNADFDGDQMAVHVPLSTEAQMEARLIMMAVNNIFSPSDGRPIAVPSQDIVLGCCYLTKEKDNLKGAGKTFATSEEVIIAYNDNEIGLHAKIKLQRGSEIIPTTPGRVIFNEHLPEKTPYVNEVMSKSKLSKIITTCYKEHGHHMTIKLLDDLKTIGFEFATIAGLSIAIDYLKIPQNKKVIIEKAQKEVDGVENQYRKGLITNGERYNKVIDIWTHATEQVSDLIFKELESFNPIFMMADSGARGSKQQIRQLAGMRGLMAKPSGEIIENPITANFREGLTVLEYFISTHGARKGLADTALKTADSGYLTRRLVDVAQDVIVTEEDCGTINGITTSAIIEGDEVVVSLKERIVGRVALDNIVDIISDTVIVKAGEEITEEKAEKIEESGIEKIRIRSVLTCDSKRGVCIKCYGRNLATRRMVELGEAVGIIAAQSIGEPGTQLTMRTFHIGGTASRVVEQSYIESKNDGIVKYHGLKAVKAEDEHKFIILNRNGQISINDSDGRELERHAVPQGANIMIEDGDPVKQGAIFVRWDPYTTPILTEKRGTVKYEDIKEDVTVREEVDEATKIVSKVVIEHKVDYHPQLLVLDDNKDVVAIYPIPSGAHIVVKDGEKVKAGQLLAKTPRVVIKTKDITGGLPRVAELFEARKPKDPAIITEIDGTVEFGESKKGMRRVVIKNKSGMTKEYLIPPGKHLNVYKGDKVIAGQQLIDGPIVPQDILRVSGIHKLQEYLVNEVQEVYRLQGVKINDKHIETIVRQMLKKVKIEDAGDTQFLVGQQIDKFIFEEENERVMKKKEDPAKASPLLLGITKASLTTESFISAASFQETTRVLTDAAASGKRDELFGLKENVIMGHLIPAGTGFRSHRDIELIKNADVDSKKVEAKQEA